MRLPTSNPTPPALAAASTSHAALATATHLGWTLNVGYGAAVLILGLLSTTAWAKATAHGVAGIPPGDTPAPTPATTHTPTEPPATHANRPTPSAARSVRSAAR